MGDGGGGLGGRGAREGPAPAGTGGYSLVVVLGFLTVVTSLIEENMF